MASLSKITSNIAKTVGTVSSVTSRISSITSSEEGSSSGIRDLYTNGFYGDTTNFYPSVFSRIFDEPTYLTFKIDFDFNTKMIENFAPNNNDPLSIVAYDNMPMPFLSLGTTNYYSTFKYLSNNKGEQQRANMLYLFISGLKDIQQNYPYYFNSIEGLGDLMKINTKNGIRLKDDEGILTIKCYESLDLKITQLLQLYRKIVWDDVYQRWILPDMMRYFKMNIYISEIRLFHSMSSSSSKNNQSKLIDIPSSINSTSYSDISSSSNSLDKINNILNNACAISSQVLGTNSTITKNLNSTNSVIDSINSIKTDINSDFIKLCNNAINDVMPTIKLECNMCEFVIDDTLSHVNSLLSYKSTTQTEPVLKIKVNKLRDTQLYPLNANLKTMSNNYSIDLSLTKGSKLMKGAYISDNDLTHGFYQDKNGNWISNYSARNIELSDTNRITKTIKRINSNLDTEKNNNGNLNYRIANSSESTAAMSLLYGVLNQFTSSDAYSAATSINEIKNFIYNNDNTINSISNNENEILNLKNNSFKEILNNISKSAATEKTALTELSGFILSEINKPEATKKLNKISNVDNNIKSTATSFTKLNE